MWSANPLDFTGKAVLVTGGSGSRRTPVGEWTVVPMVTGNCLKIPGS